MSAVLVSLLLLTVFAIMYTSAYRLGLGRVDKQRKGRKRRGILHNGFRKNGPSINWKNIVVFVGCAVLGFLLCAWSLRQNRFVYYWDYGGYWTSSYSYMQSIFADTSRTVKALYQSILYQEYNYLLPALLVLPLRIFGYTFTQYVLINYVFFFVPTAWILCCMLKKMLERSGILAGPNTTLLFPLIPFLFPVLYLAMLSGYVDIACLTPASLSLLLMMDYDPLSLERKQILRDILISLLLLTTLLFRRYFAYFVFGYGITLAALSAYFAAGSHSQERFYLRRGKNSVSLPMRVAGPILNLLLIALIALFILLLFFRPFLLTLMNNSYAEQYSGYDAPLNVKLQTIANYYGWFILLLAAVGLITSFLKKRLRRVAAFCAVSGVVSAAAFFTVQNMGAQHTYILSLQLMLLFAMGIAFLSFLSKNLALRRSIAAVLLLVSALGTAYCFIPTIRPALSSASPVFSQTHNPLRRDDIPTLHALADQLNSLTDGTNKRVYICASGFTLNFSIMQSLDKPYASNALNNLMITSDVDLRDGFPVQFFQADYVVVTDPVDLHLAEGTQEVVRYLSQEIMDNSSFLGRHYACISDGFPLDNHKTAYIYQKETELEREDYLALAEYYTNLYPNNQSLFADRILSTIK